MDIYGTVINVGHEEEDRGQYDKRKSVFSAYGASFLVKRSLFNRLGGFDERFFLQFEETDFCWRANLLGFNVIYAPASLAYHVGRASIRAKYLAQWRVRSYGLYTRNRVRSILKNMEGRNLLGRFLPMSLIYLAASLGYSLIERNPMYAAAYAGAIVWNVRLLADTLRERAKIKGMRVVSDADLERKMYTRSIFLWRSYFPSSLF
jgi:GT2 family glycosyltransferase